MNTRFGIHDWLQRDPGNRKQFSIVHVCQRKDIDNENARREGILDDEYGDGHRQSVVVQAIGPQEQKLDRLQIEPCAGEL